MIRGARQGRTAEPGCRGGGSFIEDQSTASCEGGCEVSHRRELSAVDLSVRGVWAGDAIRAFGLSGHCHADDFGSSSC
jgi:hypothetical protein